MIQDPGIMMESNLSMLSSLKEDFSSEDYILPHYKEAYRLAIDCLVNGGKRDYQEFIQAEKILNFLSEDEIDFITQSTEQLPVSEHIDDVDFARDDDASTGTYWPTNSDTPAPDLDLGWPEVMHNRIQTNIELLYHPPRLNSPNIKEVLRKNIQQARQVIAIAMDVFTDIDIFKEVVDASIRGIPVYILLDDFHFKSFLAMATNLDIQIQKLRNMRVRTVQGHEYVCKSGAKFHGGMGQKFVLVDCQTVFFGSYSLMWSCEKIHLNMVQVITGGLVESYDEEFRTLYARSNIPVEFQSQDILQDRRINGKTENYFGHPIRNFERKDHLRHTLDSVYRQTCERQAGFRSTVEDLPIPHHSRFLQDALEFNKRHSYAGERREPSHIIQHPRYGTSNWNVTEDVRLHGGNYPAVMENPFESSRLNLINRSNNLRQSYHGHDKQVLSMQQNLPSLANTSKSFLRTWRIESYLNNYDAPIGESYDYLDQYEMENKPVPTMPSRLRSSLVFRSIIPEDSEPNSYTNDSLSSKYREDQCGIQPVAHYYPSTQWNQTELMDNRIQPDDFMLKRRSIQVPERSGTSLGFGSGRDLIYASLGRAKSRFQVKEPELPKDNLYKRHSVADPRHNTYNSTNKENPSLMYEHLYRNHTEKGSVVENSKNGGYPQNLKEDQRSISQYDFQKAESNDVQRTIWQEPPLRTVSTTVLEVEDINQNKSNASSPHFFKKSTKKIKSLLNIPEKRDGSPKRKHMSSLKMDGSCDTITSEDNEYKTQYNERQHNSTTTSMKSTDSNMSKRANGRISGKEFGLTGESSAPRFSTEKLHSDGSVRAQDRLHSSSQDNRKNLLQSSTSQWQRDQVGANRAYSRFEPLCSFEAKQTSVVQVTNASINKAERHRSSFHTRGNLSADQSNHLGQHNTNHENKFGRLIQRFGNFINKK
ncbi:protein FAM83B [Clarias gariepinus]|uniref:protein FAM83B n=1 Tax=Clarias gariepinus TaxID=13013 RepID=UPI00234DAA63|nr:protein FAM83B [Clarias gariepinus]XP_053358424.1 protein FAM83B [Clarias gariepinus]